MMVWFLHSPCCRHQQTRPNYRHRGEEELLALTSRRSPGDMMLSLFLVMEITKTNMMVLLPDTKHHFLHHLTAKPHRHHVKAEFLVLAQAEITGRIGRDFVKSTVVNVEAIAKKRKGWLGGLRSTPKSNDHMLRLAVTVSLVPKAAVTYFQHHKHLICPSLRLDIHMSSVQLLIRSSLILPKMIQAVRFYSFYLCSISTYMHLLNDLTSLLILLYAAPFY